MLSAIIRIYNDSWHIGNCLNNIYDQFDELVLIEGGWNTLISFGQEGYKNRRSTDGTLDIIDKFIYEHKQDIGKIKYVKTEDSVLPPKYGKFWDDTYPYIFWDVTDCKKGDYALIIDSDEIYSKKDAKRVADFAKSNKASRMAVWAYNLISVDRYRSDSYNGPMGIGGRIERFGEFSTDRYLSDDTFGPIVVIPNVWCFHYSLYKPLKHLIYKCAYDKSLKHHWHLDEHNNIVFVDGNTIMIYEGELPEGYNRNR
jgi:hypothetical protein